MHDMNWKLLEEIRERVEQLTPAEKLYLIERIAGRVRNDHFTDHEAIEKGLDAMANDPGIQKEIELWRGADSHAAG